MPEKPDDSEYLATLNAKERSMHELYEEIRDSKNESKLLSLIRSGKLKVTDMDQQMSTPLMIAVQYNFSEATISELIELGSDVNAVDADGSTSLHHAVIMNDEDSSIFKLLLSKGADPDIEDNDGETSRRYAQENANYKDAFEIVKGPALAISMTKSQYEKQ